MGYAGQIVKGAFSALVGGPRIYGFFAQVGVLAVTIGIGIQPEIRGVLDQIATGLGVRLQDWHFLFAAALLWIVILSIRLSFALTPRVQFLEPRLEGGHYITTLFVPIQKLGAGRVEFTARVEADGKKHVVMTEERAREKAREGKQPYIGRYNLGAEPKNIKVLTLDFTKESVVVEPQQGERIALPLKTMNLTLTVDDGDVTIEKHIGILKTGAAELHLSDGQWGADVDYYGEDKPDQASQQ